MEIIKSTYEEIKHFRTEYLISLPEFQELHIELMLADSDFFLLKVDDIEIGYSIRTDENVLIEFFVKDRYIPQSLIYFNQIVVDLSISEIYCKSFDFLLLSNCMLNSYPYSILGVLFRDYYDKAISDNLELSMSLADQDSAELVLTQDDSIKELFETENQLSEFIATEKVFTFYKNNNLIGCGTVLKTHKDWDYCDLGVWVNPEFRKHGIATQIIFRLRKFALENGMKPSCGCAIDNIASQKTLEKSGFISKHKLISFKVN